MDIKCDGLYYEILAQALAQANEGRMHILNIIEQTLPAPREDYKPNVPRVTKMMVAKEFIGAIIGPQGKIIQEIQKDTNTIITIEEAGDQGIVEIASVNKEGIDAAVKRIKSIVTIPEVGEVYEGTVKNLQPFGAFVEFLPGKDGLLHVSEISWKRVDNVEEVLQEGDMITVKLIDIDKKTGKFKLSHRVLTPKPEGYVEQRPQRQFRQQDRRPQSGNNRNR